MRVLVFGSGAIGGLVGAGLIDAGADVALLDRGSQYSALKSGGLRVVDRQGRTRTLTSMRVVREPSEFPHAELVILAVKAHQILPALSALEKSVAGGATLLTLQNGIPWWYFLRAGGPFAGRTLQSVDCDGVLASRIDAQRIVGCIAYPAAELVEPGLVRHVEGDRFPIGEIDGSRSARCTAISALLERAGFKSPVLDDVRSEIWVKAWGTLAFNPVSALTGMTMAEICSSPDARALVVRMMTESREIATRLGVTMRVPLEKRLLGAERVGHHKTSMLQDLEAGRPLEIEAILGAVVELGELLGAHGDTLRSVLELTRAIDPGRRTGSAGPPVEAAAAS
jgi:2-dehydropantoate 2-reductase